MRAGLLIVCVATGAALLVPTRGRAADQLPAAEDSPRPAPLPSAVDTYERESKSVAGALALSLVLPGAGSVYADHLRGAIITWTLVGAGVGAIAWTSAFPTRHGDISGPNF